MIGGLRKTSLYLLAGASALGMLAIGGTPAKAEANTEQLEAAIRAMQAQMKDLQRQVNEAKQAAATPKSGGGEDLDLKVKWKGAPELSSKDGKFKMKVRGRIMVDYDGIDQDFPITGEEDVSAVELRRARIGVEGTVWYDWKYKAEVDFAGDASEIKDMYIAYANWAPWEKAEIIFGNFKVANSLEEMTSSRFITFLERSAYIDAFELDRQIGAGVWAGDEHWSFQIGYYGTTSGDQETWFVDNTAAAVRGTVAPINNDTTVVHLGASYRHRNSGTPRDFGDPDALFRYRARPDLHLASRFINTDHIAEEDDMFNLEGAVVWKSFSVQGEYSELEADPAIGIMAPVDPTYTGWYVEASVFLTGEMRNYEADEGAFGRTKVKNPVFGGSGGWGAWQLAGRYDSLDLSSGAALIPVCEQCGTQEAWTIGLNWLLTDYTALKFNYVNAEIGGGNGGNPPGSGFNEDNGATIQGFAMRAQIDW